MKKRMLSLLLTLCMAVSLLPTAVFAAGTTDEDAAKPVTSVTAGSGSVQVKKSVNEAGTELTLEAYLTNEVTETVSAKPLDIVLVLDQSGSMAFDFNGKKTEDNTARRQYAMKQAVDAFITKVGEQYSKQGDHRMAIVTFGSEATQLVGWTAVDASGKTALTNEINGLPQEPEGATNVGAGMQEAQTLMNSAKNGADRQKVVIVFTDGVPTTTNEFNTGVANSAIKAAKAMKDTGTAIYTVGIFNGANPDQLYGNSGFDKNSDGSKGSNWSDFSVWMIGDIKNYDVPAGNRFLNYLSSNFAATNIGLKKYTATILGIGYHGWEITENFDRAAEGNYYLTATSSGSLNAIFQQIITEISTLDIVADTNTILSDTLSEYFALNVPDGVTDAKTVITAEKWDCIGKGADGNYTWEKAKADAQPTTKIEVTGKTINVTGFDYTENAVTATKKGNETSYSGAKLVVTIPIKPDTTCTAWKAGENAYPTNSTTDGSKAGLSGYKDKDGNAVDPTLLDRSPEVNVTAYSVTYTDGVDGEEIFANQASTVLLGAATPAFKGTPSREGYVFKGWSPDVAQTVTGNATYTAQWEKQTTAETFTVTYKDGRGGTFFSDKVYSNLKNGDATPTYNNGTDPTHKDYIFKGWSPTVAPTVTGNATYTAQWESKSEHLIKELLDKIKVECVNTSSSHTAKEYDTSVGGYSAVTTQDQDGKYTSTITVEAKKYVARYNTDTNVTHNLADGEAATQTIVVKFDSYDVDVSSIEPTSGTLPVVFKVTCAQPQPDLKYTLTYDANGGTLNSGMTSPVIDKKSGDTVDLDYSNQPTHSQQAEKNVIFIGWTQTDTDEKVYANGETLPSLAKQVAFANSNITVYAVWGLDENGNGVPDVLEAKVTYKIVNGQWFDPSSSDPGATVTSEDQVAYIPLYEKSANGVWTTIDAKLGTTIPTGHRGDTGYISDGWYKDAETTRTEISAATPVTGNVTYTFKYVKQSSGGGGSSTTYYYFAIEKIDAQDNHTLSGAKFGLYLDGKQIATATSDRSGIAMFRITASDYRKIDAKSELYYQELTAPEGYVANSDKVSMEKSDLTTNRSQAEKDAETVRNHRGSTPDLLNGDDHFAYVIGYQDGTVRPNAPITRAETATIFFRLLKDEVRDGKLSTSNTFTDMSDARWANTAVSTMAGLGIVQGRSSTAFDPNASITRAEFAAICARFDTGKSSGTQSFSDIKGHWAQSYIERAAELGWIKGFEDGTFHPDDCITRAQAMTMINRVLNRIPEEASDLLPSMNVWPDCAPSDWFYLAVQEGTNSHDFKHKAGNYETWTSMKQDPDWTRYEN